MYESQTYESILNRMMKRALEKYANLDSREGSMLWLGHAPAAVEFQNLYIALDTVLKETFADTASREYLIQRAAERGLPPYPASCAILELTITPAELELRMGTRFSINELNYAVTARKSPGVYEITCETPGEAGNQQSGTVIPIEFIQGLETCVITSLLIPGEDDEDTDSFRQRYFDSLNTQAFGGNKADYIAKVNAIQGVGGVKVYRAWNGNIRPADFHPPDTAESWISGLKDLPEGIETWVKAIYAAANNNLLTVGGTVRLVIIDSTFTSPSEELIQKVQTAIDPTQNSGEGLGLAPIGHVVKVEGVKKETVNLSVNLTYKDDWNWAAVQTYVETAVSDYFLELAKGWASAEEPVTVRIAQIESRILDLTGITDITGTMLNESDSNLVLDADSIPVLGTITDASGE